MKPSTGILTVNLSAIESNWQRINRAIDLRKTSAAAVIKANAYGLGAAQVAPTLYAAGCREFFLATLEEGIAARSYLPADAILFVLGGVRAGAEEQFLRHRLIPVLFSLGDIQCWQNACALRQITGQCAIKINTGMTRLGLDLDEFASLFTAPMSLAHLQPVLVMSHLACADEGDHPLNRQQLNRFLLAIDLCKSSLPGVRFSLANSSGIFLGQEWHFDLVRPGAALYGINPRPQLPSAFAPVVHLQLPILQTRKLQQRSSIGYGGIAELPASSRLAVVAGGYADGLHRTIGRQGGGMIGNQTVSVVGRISMDTTIFDVSSALESESVEGAMIQVLGEQLTVNMMAERTGALGYEILTSLGSRYQRRYVSAKKAGADE